MIWGLLCKQAEQEGDAGMLSVNGVGRRGKHSRIPNGKIYKCIQKSLSNVEKASIYFFGNVMMMMMMMIVSHAVTDDE